MLKVKYGILTNLIQFHSTLANVRMAHKKDKRAACRNAKEHGNLDYAQIIHNLPSKQCENQKRHLKRKKFI